jgi:hypothetical protein
MRSPALRSLLSATFLVAATHGVQAQVNVTTYHYDTARSGLNSHETILTPANVNSNQFGKLFSVPVDGVVQAQPLYLQGVHIAGGTHNVAYVVTEHDSVYAIDADNGAVYAHVSLILSGGTTVSAAGDLSCLDVIPELGITGTPVIDPVAGILYVVAVSKLNGQFFQYLHALDVTTLSDKLAPVSITATVPGSGYDASNGYVTFNPLLSFQRPALLLDGSHVVIGWGSQCDHNPWHGWLISYDSTSLALEGVRNMSPNGGQNGIWMSGSGPAADASGNIYFATGNGPWDGSTNYGDSVVKVGPPASGTFPVLDYFTPYDQASLSSDDADLGSGGVMLLPTLSSGLQLLTAMGKQGIMYVLKQGNLGKYCPNLTPACTNSDPNAFDEIVGSTTGIWGAPAYWNGNIYYAGLNQSIQAFSVTASGVTHTPSSQSAQIFAFAAPVPTVSANGTSSAIMWALDGAGYDSLCDTTAAGSHCLGLYAYDATNLGNLLYTSAQAPGGRDTPSGIAVKLQSPIVANGKVYVGTQSTLDVYGHLSGATPLASEPTISPMPGTYTVPQTVSLSDSTAGATIYYSTNGSTPTTSSNAYKAPFQVASTRTVRAMAVAPGYQQSATAAAAYFLPVPVVIGLSAVDDMYGITSNGSAPQGGGFDYGGHDYSSNLLGSSITWNGSTFAFGAPGTENAVSNTTISLPVGHYTNVNLLGAAVNGNQPNQVFTVTYTDGSTQTFTQGVSDWFTAHTYPGETVVKTMAYRIDRNGAQQPGPVYLYGYSFAIDSARTVKSLTLPLNSNVVILAVDVSNTPVNDVGGFTSAAGLTFVGGAKLSGNTLQLSDGGALEARAVWTAAQVNVQNFTTDFNFQITPASANAADGFTFTVQKQGSAALGIYGSGLGYQGITNSVAVKFDLYNNAGEGNDSTGIYVNGAAPILPAIDMTGSINLHSGDPLHAHITYDGTTLIVSITDTVTGGVFTTSKAINILSTIGSDTAWVGFTAGTGSVSSVQQISNWTYTSGLTPVVDEAAGFSSTSGLYIVNGAVVTSGLLELTDGGSMEANAAWTTSKVNVQLFTCDFSFLESAATGDGFTFTLQNQGPAALGIYGSGLGYQGITNSVAVKFDLYNNAGEGNDSTGFYVDGATPTVPSTDMSASGVNLHSGDLMHAHINYDTKTLTLVLTDTATGASFTTAKAINIPATLGATTAYAGFTAGTGTASAVQRIINWTYVVN